MAVMRRRSNRNPEQILNLCLRFVNVLHLAGDSILLNHYLGRLDNGGHGVTLF